MKPRIWPLCFKRMPAGPPLALAWSKLFSKAERSHGAKHFGPKAADSERRAMVCLTYNDSPAASLLLSWTRPVLYMQQEYPDTLANTRKRLDKGVKTGPRAKLAGKVVEKTWIKRRRASVRAAAASTSGQKPVDHEVAIANLSQKAQKDRAGWS